MSRGTALRGAYLAVDDAVADVDVVHLGQVDVVVPL